MCCSNKSAKSKSCKETVIFVAQSKPLYFKNKQDYPLSYFHVFLNQALIRFFWCKPSACVARKVIQKVETQARWSCCHDSSCRPLFLLSVLISSKTEGDIQKPFGSSLVFLSITKSKIQCCAAIFSEYLTELQRQNFLLLSYIHDPFLRNIYFCSTPSHVETAIKLFPLPTPLFLSS